EDLIAGEEPELCVRLRQAGWRLHRLDRHMATHDAEMMRFSQWWKRSVRSGHAAAEGMALHGRSPERFRVREVRSSLIWGGVAPLLFGGFLLGGFAWGPLWAGAGATVAISALQGIRIARDRKKRGESASDARLYAFFCMLAKLPETIGIVQYSLNRLLKRRSELIEYK
ncbi:MAG: glycosyltransferase family 2 protein, partial [Candidatus Hydrogenedentota bacterium]